MSVSRIGLVVHGGRAEAVQAAHVVRAWCHEHTVRCKDIDVWNDGGRHSAREEMAAAGDPDLIVTLGGDGTFLRGARLAAAVDALVLGVDLGRVGFLTEVPAAGVRAALDAVGEDRMEVEQRMLLTMRSSRRLVVPSDMESLMRYGRGPLLPPPHVRTDCEAGHEWGIPLDVAALNDVVLEKLVRDRQVSVGVYLAGRLLASYSADALLVATPTGSTAYSFAAGGPVVSPRADAVIFTPVAPHMTFNRSVVAAPDEPVGLRVLERSGRAAISIDGQLRGVLDPGDWIGVYPAPRRLRAVRLGPMDFYGRLRERMHLTDAPAAIADGTPAPLWPVTTPPPRDLAHLAMPERPGLGPGDRTR
ncbi:NAD(+)/NADH kinase [Streptomyces sp. NPDC052309]|uniref:NAD(+)/NADH kinase n=1 Tax=Streptomyces sp. NPDC052309 TaxID=3155421 RepID=UPI00341732D7